MGIKHEDTKTTGQKGYASEWNKNHIIDSDVDFDSNKAINVTDPTADQDAATKKYVDDAVKGTRYLAINPGDFTSAYPDVDDVNNSGALFDISAGTVTVTIPVSLPHGVKVTGAVVYGDVASEARTWYLIRIDHIGGPSTMAQANVNTEDTTISYDTINNQDYSYVISVASCQAGDTLYGARLVYTV